MVALDVISMSSERTIITSTSKQVSHGLIMAITFIAIFMDGLDGSIVMIALPSLAAFFGAAVADMSWVVLVYLLTLTAGILLCGKIIEKHGVRRMMIAGFFIFAVSSLLCGISQTPAMLIGGRIIQGIGACMMAACAPAMIALYMPASKRGLGFGVIAAGLSVGFALGPVIGGLLVGFLSWHWIFFINIPIGIAAAILTAKWLPLDHRTSDSKGSFIKTFDLVGALLFIGGISGVMIVLNSWSLLSNMHAIAALAGSLGLLALFLWHEKQVEDPLLDPAFFKSKRYIAVTIAIFAAMAAFSGLIFILPFYFEGILAMTTVMAGLMLFIPSAFCSVLCPLAGKAADIFGARRLVIGGALAGIGTFVMILLYDSTALFLVGILGLIVYGISMGLTEGPGSARMIEFAPPKRAAVAAAMVSTTLYCASAFGTAIFTGIFSYYASTEISEALLNGTFLEGFYATNIAGLVLMCIALLCTWIVLDQRKECSLVMHRK